MIHRLTIWSVVGVVLACPQVCRSRLQGCCASASVVQHACCERCDAAVPPGEATESPLPGDSERPCAECCLCKGAVLGATAVDVTPEVQSGVCWLIAPLMTSLSLVDIVPRTFADSEAASGSGARIALCSLQC